MQQVELTQQPMQHANGMPPQYVIINSSPTQPQSQHQEYKGGATSCKGRHPQQFYCNTCKKEQMSMIRSGMGCCSWIWCLCCIPGISCLPCCMEGMQNTVHRCPGCSQKKGKQAFCCC
jgi:hypothetical protein